MIIAHYVRNAIDVHVLQTANKESENAFYVKKKYARIAISIIKYL